MTSHRNWLDPGGSVLRRLDQLRSRLEMLGSHLRETVAQALGRTLGNVVRDAVLRFLESLVRHLPAPGPSPTWSRRPLVSTPELDNHEDDGREDDLWSDDSDDRVESEPFHDTRPEGRRPRGWVLALTAGLRAASWLVPRSNSRRALLAASALAALVAAVGYLSPALAAAGLTLVATAQHLGLLSTLLQSLPV